MTFDRGVCAPPLATAVAKEALVQGTSRKFIPSKKKNAEILNMLNVADNRRASIMRVSVSMPVISITFGSAFARSDCEGLRLYGRSVKPICCVIRRSESYPGGVIPSL